MLVQVFPLCIAKSPIISILCSPFVLELSTSIRVLLFVQPSYCVKIFQYLGFPLLHIVYYWAFAMSPKIFGHKTTFWLCT